MGETEVPSVLQKLQKWGDYPSLGGLVQPTRFLPCKTPLSCEIIRNWSLAEGPKHGLTLPGLLNDQAQKGRKIGLVIDLSNHETLYAADMPVNGLQYVHIQLVAKVFPQQNAINLVIETAKTFWEEHPTEHIAIHCAYGFNRTGFVVCAYLILVCGFSVDEALASFERARPPGVRHEKFVEELRRRYDVQKPLEGSPCRSSLGSLHSDMGLVAEYLVRNNNMLDTTTSRGNAVQPGPAFWGQPGSSYSMSSAHDTTSREFGRSRVSRDSNGDAVALSAYPGASSDRRPPLPSSSVSSETREIPIPSHHHRGSMADRSIGSQASIGSIKNDSLGVDHMEIIDNFLDQEASAFWTEHRSSDGKGSSRRWRASPSNLSCTAAGRELHRDDSSEPGNVAVRDLHQDDSSLHSSGTHHQPVAAARSISEADSSGTGIVESPFASAQYPGDDEPKGSLQGSQQQTVHKRTSASGTEDGTSDSRGGDQSGQEGSVQQQCRRGPHCSMM